MALHHLTSEEREVISQMLFAQESKAAIARRLGRPRSTIFRELKRNRGPQGYSAVKAQRRACKRRLRRPRKIDQPEIREYVESRIKRYWSPEQIDGRAQRDFCYDRRHCISRQTIYNWLNKDGQGQRWKCYLRFYRLRKTRTKSVLPGQDIQDRPAVINERNRYGDWEADTIVGSAKIGTKPVLVSLVERSSGYLELARVENREAQTVNRALRKRLRKHPPNWRLSMTTDNGPEFAKIAELARQLQLQVYYAKPGCPWQRGTNENTNGLVRQFFKKGTSFRDIAPDQVEQAQTLLNERPRKRLGYQTPSEILAKHASDAIQT